MNPYFRSRVLISSAYQCIYPWILFDSVSLMCNIDEVLENICSRTMLTRPFFPCIRSLARSFGETNVTLEASSGCNSVDRLLYRWTLPSCFQYCDRFSVPFFPVLILLNAVSWLLPEAQFHLLSPISCYGPRLPTWRRHPSSRIQLSNLLNTVIVILGSWKGNRRVCNITRRTIAQICKRRSSTIEAFFFLFI